MNVYRIEEEFNSALIAWDDTKIFSRLFLKKNFSNIMVKYTPKIKNWLFTDKSGLATANLPEFSTKYKKWK